MTCRCAQMQTLLFNFTLKLPYILLYLVHLSDDKKLKCKLNTFRDVVNTILDGLQRIVERHRSIHLLVRDNTFVVVHIDTFLNGSLNAKNPVGTRS